MRALLIACCFLCSFAYAAPISSGRSVSVSPVRTSIPMVRQKVGGSVIKQTTPQPPQKVVQNMTINRTTVVQSSPAVSGVSGGGGFFSGIISSFAGASLANWLFPPKPAVQPTQTVDCSLQQNQVLAVCQPKQ